MTDPIFTDGVEGSRRRSDWMRAAQAGDRESYRALLDAIGPAVQAALRRMLADRDDVADAYQDTLLALHRYRHTCRPSRPFEPWLFAIVREVACRHLRRSIQPRRAAHAGVLPEHATELDLGLAPQRRQDPASLSPSQSVVIALVMLEGRTGGETPDRDGTPPGAPSSASTARTLR